MKAALELAAGTITRAHPDEPVFVLRAQDQLAADIVRRWADDADAAGVDPLKVAEARELALEMDAWPSRRLPT